MNDMHNARQRLLAAIAAAYAPMDGTLVGETLVLPDKELSLHGLPRFLQLLSTSTEFTRLPPLFGSDQGLPMASMYVELAVCQSRTQPTPTLLGTTPSLSASLEERHRQQQARRLSVDDALGTGQHGHVVILGDPGSGKTSLLKRATALIASGQWPGWILPLYIPLRRYWETRRNYPDAGMTLRSFAASRIVEMNHHPDRSEFVSGVAVLPKVAQQLQAEIDEVCSLLDHISGAQRKNVLFLLDGLDEIASDREAIDVLNEEIRQLGHGFAWILTSRRAGFFGGLEESIRFEVVSLDNGGIEQLTHNWFAHQDDARARTSGAARVLAQIMDNPRLLTMARNPFLLTLLCHLHADGALPLYRSQVYERIFKLAREQLWQREKDRTLFGLPELGFLSNFCRHLYADAPRAPRHLFDRDDWASFAAPAQAPDLERHFFKSRLLNQWGDVGDYHLVHLTLHEYLVARALAQPQVPVTEALTRIHQPHWRMVLRFLAGRYRDEGRMADLACLLKAMLAPVDLNGLMYLEVAQLLLEARIEDSSELLGHDLRETLWGLWQDDTPLIAEVAGQALATLAPGLMLGRVQTLLDEVQGRFAIGSRASAHDVAGNRALRAIGLLAEVQLDAASGMLIGLLLDEQRPQLADGAITALVKRNWPAVRRAVLDAAATVADQGATFVRICHLAAFSRHRDFAAWLLARLEARAAPAPELLVACALVGGSLLDVALLRRVQADLALTDTWSSEIWDAVASGSEAWRAWLCAATRAREPAQATTANTAMLATAIRQRLQGPEAILACFEATEDEEDLSTLIEAIGDGALANQPTAHVLEQALAGYLSRPGLRRAAVFSLSVLDEQRIARDAAPRYCAQFIKLLRDDDDEVRELAIETLGVARERAALRPILALLADKKQHLSIRVAAIHSLIHLANDDAQEIAECLEDRLSEAMPEVVLEAAIALACIQPALLGRHLASSVVRRALAQVGAEQGMVFFDAFYVDASGTRHEWDTGSVGAAAAMAEPTPAPTLRPVFISFNSKDEDVVGSLVAQLKAAGIPVLWDREDLARHGLWQDELYSLIQSAGSALVICGAHGPGPWQKQEIHACLQRTTHDKSFSLRSVWLPNVASQAFAGFIDNYDRIDLRAGVQIELLLASLRQPNPASASSAIAAPALLGTGQYSGLWSESSGSSHGQVLALDSFLPNPQAPDAGLMAAAIQQAHLSRRLADPKVRARWSLDDLDTDEYDALRLIHLSCICRRVDYLSALWPGRAWSVITDKLVQRGVLEWKDCMLSTETHVATYLAQDTQTIRASHEQWIARLTPLAGHWDLAMELCIHLFAVQRFSEAAELLHTHIFSVEEAWVQDIFGQFANALISKPRIARQLSQHERILVLDTIGVHSLKRGETGAALDAFCRMGKIATRTHDEWGLGQSWLHRGLVWFARQDYAQAARCYHRAAEQARSSGDDFLLGRALHNQAQCLVESDAEHATKLLEESAECKRRIGDKEGLFATYDCQAHLARQRGDLPGAERWYLRAVKLARRTDWRTNLAHGLSNLASCLCDLGCHNEARKHGEEAYAIAHELQDRGLLILTTKGLAVRCHHAGDNERARTLFAELAELMQKYGEYEEAVLALADVGAVCVRLSDAHGARYSLDQAIALARCHRIDKHLSHVLNNYAASYFSIGQIEAGLDWLAQAGQDAAGCGEWAVLAQLCKIEANWRDEQGEDAETVRLLWDRAVVAISNSQDWPRRIELMIQRYAWMRNHLGRAVALPAIEELVTTLRARRQLRREYATALTELGNAHQELGQYQQSIKTYQRALKVLEQAPDANLSSNLLHNFAELMRKIEQFEQAIAIYTGLLELIPAADLEQRLPIEHNMALAEAGAGEIEKAQARLARIRDVSGKRKYWETHTRAWLALGNFASHAENHRLALQRYDKAVSLATAHDLADLRLQAELHRAELLLALDRAGEVVAALVPISALFNRHLDGVELLKALAQGFCRCGQAQMAVRFLQQALGGIGESDPRYAEIRALIAHQEGEDNDPS